MNRFYKQRGIALAIVLWMLALLSIMATGYSRMMRNESTLTANLINSTQANALAEAGITEAIAELLKPTNEQIWKTDGTTYDLFINNSEIRIQIRAENGKIDLNTARSELLLGLFQSVSVPEEEQIPLVQAILDWRDKDNLTRTDGAEDDDYINAGKSYEAKDGPFNSLNELLLVKGMTPTLFKKIKPALTIYSHSTNIYMRSASREVLLAIPSVEKTTIETYLTDRNSIKDSNQSPPLIGVDSKYISNTRGTTFSIISEATVNNATSRIETVISTRRYNNYPYSILAWQTSPLIKENEQEIEES